MKIRRLTAVPFIIFILLISINLIRMTFLQVFLFLINSDTSAPFDRYELSDVHNSRVKFGKLIKSVVLLFRKR